MSDGLSIPLHLAVHLVGLAAVAGLLAYAVGRRRSLGPTWPGLALGGLILGVQHVAVGLVLTGDAPWPVYARAVAYAAIAVGVAGANVGATTPVVVAIAPIAVHVTAGIAGLLAAVSSLRGVARRGGLLASGVALWAVSDMLVRSQPDAASLLAVAGSAAVLGWTSTAARTSVRARLLAVITVLVSIAVVLVAASTGTLFTDQFRQDAIDRLRSPVAAIADDVQRAWPRDLETDALVVAGSPTTINLLGRAVLPDNAANAVRLAGGGDLTILFDRDGQPIDSSWRATPAPPTWVTALAGDPTTLAAQATDTPQIGMALLRGGDIGRTAVATFAVQIVRRSSSDGIDERLGAVLVAELLDDTDVQDRKRNVGADFVVTGGDEVLLTTDRAIDGELVLGALRADDPTVEGPKGELLLAAAPIDGLAVPIRAVALQQTAILAEPDEETARKLFERSLIALAVGLLGGLIASRALARPVQRLTDVVDRVAAGDLSSRVPVEGRADELGRLADAFDDMTVALGARQEALQRAASTEAELRGRLQAITDSMTDGLIATDRQGRITAANLAAARLAGFEVDEVIGQPIDDVLEGRTPDGGDLRDRLGNVVDGEGLGRVDARFVPTDLEVAITASPLRGTSGSAPIVGSVFVIRDVTAEAELAKARRDFVTNISHELRTPLTLIMAPVRQLEKWRTRDEIAVIQAEVLNRGTARMARLERELTEWAQLDLGRYARIEGEANLDEVRKRSIDLVAWQFPEREIRVRIPSRLPTIAVSTEAVSTIVRELVHNAVLFSKHGGAPVDVRFKRVDGGVELTVRDRGIGMDDDTAARAFEPYWQLDPSERRDFDGLGIGLTLAQRVAEACGTTVTLTSRPGRGTTATVVFPAH